MPKKNDNNYNDALGSIYQFLFEEAEKPPEKRKPVKLTGLSGESFFVDALSTIIQNPAAYVGNTVMDGINDAFNADVLNFDIDKQGGKLEIKANDLATIIKDPNKFFDSQYKKAETIRKQNRVRWFSRPIQQQVFTAWAMKNGFSSEEATVLGQAVGSGLSDSGFVARLRKDWSDSSGKRKPGDKLKLGMKVGYADSDMPQFRGFARGMRKDDAINAFDKGWAKSGLPDNTRKAYIKGLLQTEVDQVGGLNKLQLSNFLQAKGFPESSDIFKNVMGSFGFDDSNASNRRLLSGYFRGKAEQAEALGDTAGRDRYGRAVSILNTVDNDTILQDTRDSIRKLQDAISGLPASQRNNGNPQYRNINKKISVLRRSEADLRRGLGGGMLTYSVFSGLGQLEGFANAWNASYGISKDLIPSILNGSFFDSRGHKNSLFSPSKTMEIGTTKGVFEIHVARGAGVPYREELMGVLNGVYYFTPAGILSTLTTGEGFAYLLNQSRKSLNKQFKSLSVGDMSFLIQIGIDPRKAGFDIASVMADPKKYAVLKDFLIKRPNSPISRKLLPLIKNDERFLALADLFSWSTKLKNSVGMSVKKLLNRGLAKSGLALDDEALKALGINQVINRYIGAKILASKIWKDHIEGYLIRKLGEKVAKEISSLLLKEGLRSALVGLFTALGSSLGPLGTALGYLASEIIMALGYEMARIGILFLLLVALGLIATILVLQYGAASSFAKLMNLHTDISPTEVVQCSAWQPSGLLPIEGEEEPGGFDGEFTPGNLPPGTTCLFAASSSLRCTQAPYTSCSIPGHRKPSHANSPAIDVAIGGNFSAPQFCDSSKGNCKVTAVGQETCAGGSPAGGYVRFSADYNGRTYEFYVLHVAPGVSTGQTLGAGQAVATIIHDPKWKQCSTGLHAHLSVKVNGSYVNPRDVMNQDFGCSISECPTEVCM